MVYKKKLILFIISLFFFSFFTYLYVSSLGPCLTRQCYDVVDCSPSCEDIKGTCVEPGEPLHSCEKVFLNGKWTGECALREAGKCGTGPGCMPSCQNKECGSDGCSGECPNTCGLYYKSCSSNNLCIYNPGSISFDYEKLCVDTLSNNNKIKLTINCTYCGNKVFISSNLNDQVYTLNVNNTIQVLTYNLDLPNISYFNDNLVITVKGNRNEIKDIKDEDIYPVTDSKTIILDHNLFYYCPKISDINGNLIYTSDLYFVFYNNSLLYDWNDCFTNINLAKCVSLKNSCIDINNNSFWLNRLTDADNDGEIEICYSRDNLNGGWLDLDVNSGNCSLMKIAKIENNYFYSTWFSCQNSNQCLNAIDTFKPNSGIDLRGVCCGDDYEENPLIHYKFKDEYKQNVFLNDLITLNIKSCCKNNVSYCVDSLGLCREIGFSYCSGDNKKDVCRETMFADSQYFFNKTNKIGVWEEVSDSNCINVCQRCNVNKEGSSYNKVDIADLTAIQNVIDLVKNGANQSSYLDIYDINKDNYITDADYTSCLSCDQVGTCGDGVIQPNEECDIKNNIYIIGDLCTDICDLNSNKTLLVNGCDSCSCTYNLPVCIKDSCGASCGVDSDCSVGKYCDQDTCSCKLKGCPVGTSLCVDGTCSSNCDVTDTGFKGCVDRNGQCEDGEGCACEDCIGKQDSCTFGAVCGVNKLCTCPVGTSLCVDGTCSSNCDVTDTGFKGCVDRNGQCEDGEGCACEDCYYKKDSCLEGFVCNYLEDKCVLTCQKTENEEITLNDGLDNDCDGLVDEPLFGKGPGLYIWDANCNYFVCGYTNDLSETNISFSVKTTKFNSVKELYLENKDLFEITNTSLKTYINLDSMDIDCFVLKSNTSLEFDVRINNRTNFSNVYITQRKINPLTMPFNYSNPICNLGCDNPNNCAKPTAFFNLLEGCSPEKCLFDCGGFWNNQSSFFDILWPKSYLNDYCENCRENMTCSNYSNEFSCVFDPCKASDTQLGCKWNGTSCLDAFKPCIPGTTLCADGSCSSNCRRTDYKEQGCINKNGICEKGEGCACEDCENKQDSCTEGAVCSAGVCSCPINTMLCNDNTCDETCENNGGVKGCINNNNICELGEGCGCSDCNEQRDSCVLNAKCNYALSKCISSEKTQCDEGTALCNDNTCDATCEEHGGFKGCIIKNNVCEDGEGCACEDCYGKQDTCKDGLICNNNICKKESNLNNENCIDNDKDGFFKMDSKCINGNDCDDNNKFINPNMVEVCGNDIDENCDGIKENCNYEQISLELLSDKSIEVLETARIKLKLINNIEKDFKNLNLKLKTPEKINTNRNIFLGELKSKDIREVIIPLVVKDYLNEEAEIVLSVTDGDNELIQDTITLTIIIPEFKIKPMPESEIENNNKICYDFYYIVNKEEGYYDIELDINNPSTIFGKSLVVDYMSNIYINGKTIQPLLGNPYCLSMDKVYEVSGYLYAPGVFKLTNKVDESKYELIN